MLKDDMIMKTGIIHILDSTMGVPVLSDFEFDLGSDLCDFLKAHIEKLKPCPFCGGEVNRTVLYGNINFFKCKSCMAVISFDGDYYNKHPNEAIEAWNRRTENDV